MFVPAGEIGDGVALEIFLLKELVFLGFELFQAVFQSGEFVRAIIEIAFSPCGDALGDVFTEDFFTSADFVSAAAHRFEISDLECPGFEVGAGLEFVFALPEEKIGFLKDVISVTGMAGDGGNIAAQPPLNAFDR